MALCLDFANTLDWHASAHPVESLHDYTDLLAWGQQAGLLTPAEVDTLAQRAATDPPLAGQCFSAALTLREAIYRIFVVSAHPEEGGTPDPADLDLLSAFWQQAARRRCLVAGEEGYQWQWRWPADDLEHITGMVVQSAVELLTSDLRERVGQCQDERGCGYLFLDTSRNRTRRWCSMESCGNRAKAQRHYTRVKK